MAASSAATCTGIALLTGSRPMSVFACMMAIASGMEFESSSSSLILSTRSESEADGAGKALGAAGATTAAFAALPKLAGAAAGSAAPPP
jgi:hypothetical protein